MNVNLDQIYGRKNHPIYIYAPPYIEFSAGIRTLHYLCHSLNQKGYLAWLIIHDTNSPKRLYINVNLNTPILNDELRDSHFRNGLVPIVVYPETIPGNPLNAQVVVRWILNYPGILGGPEVFNKKEHVVAYSSDIAKTLQANTPVLFLPALDIREIYDARKLYTNKTRTDRVLLYAGKYRVFVGNPILPRWAQTEYTEIWREGPEKQSREEVLELLATSSHIFVFENSTIITEAVLLGIPVILVKSTFFDSSISHYELGDYGTAWSDQKDAIAIASATIDGAEQQYLEAIKHFFVDLEKEVSVWLAMASRSDYLSPILIPDSRIVISQHRISLAIQILRSQGLFTLFRVIRSFLKRRYLKKSNLT
jgi:hypothetical protein